MPSRYFFLHMQKAAGTSLHRYLRAQFGDAAIAPDPARADEPGISSDVEALVEAVGERGDAVELVAGHFPLCTADVLGGDFRVFTVLRHPVERTLSLLRQRQQTVTPELSLPEIYADPLVLHGLVHNYMVKMLALTAEEMTQGQYTHLRTTEHHLEVAKRALVERVEVLGVQEDFDGFCDRLAETYGWDLGTRPRVRWNRTAPTPPDPRMSEDRVVDEASGISLSAHDFFLAHIEADNALDVELYEFARQRCPEPPAP